MTWFVILLIILAAGSMVWGIYGTLKEGEEMVEEEKKQQNESLYNSQ